ncbi:MULTISPECIES: PAS domain S-box protein [Cycloclasticus]|jgi:PAS domain S-box-containing protein|uniref:PAS domain S-box-containing protein n=1 Tax=Cycloclasticus pugetii TaxID=34068 RepID=A0AB33Z1L0_9GAMM|nr:MULTISPECIES: PAS domain S-box protein [Cycloclasticus]ATI02056.1 PAS domain S-box protein [Cycloclasticus sp. PY97N]EPD13200.1 hypothetical protein L196_06145 [Cycloclasticus pugetii]
MNDIANADLLIEQNPDAMIFADLKGIIGVWNQAAVRIFGFSKDEALGASLDIIIPESLRAAHWQGYDRALQEGKTKYTGQSLPTKAVRADGSSIYVELGFSIVVDPNGLVLGSLANAREITARYKQERANQKRMQELETLAGKKGA